MLYRFSVWLHLVAASVWVGGIFFFALVLVPVLRRARGAASADLVRSLGTRFRQVGWTSIAVLVVTGTINLVFRYPTDDLASDAFWLSPFGRIVFAKLVLVSAMILVSVIHDVLGARAVAAEKLDPGSPGAKRLRAWSSWLGRLDALLVLGILFAAVLLVRGF